MTLRLSSRMTQVNWPERTGDTELFIVMLPYCVGREGGELFSGFRFVRLNRVTMAALHFSERDAVRAVVIGYRVLGRLITIQGDVVIDIHHDRVFDSIDNAVQHVGEVLCL